MNRTPPEIWRPITGLPDGAKYWALPGYAEFAARWQSAKSALKQGSAAQQFLDGWLRERGRAFAIETGQIEGLYTLREGVTEQLIAEGFVGVVGSHTVENVEDVTIRGLLEDQEAAYAMVFEDIASGRPLSEHSVRSWHQLLTRHQKTVAGPTADGRRIQVEFKRKGVWKDRPNNPRRPDGVTHEYCPPEHVQAEIDRFFAMYRHLGSQDYPVEVEAAWLHHRFVRTHPFQDGNGRVSRLLMAYAYILRGLPPPVVTAAGRDAYIDALEVANTGDLKAFSDYVGAQAVATIVPAINLADRALAGELSRSHGNGGRTVDGQYLPPTKGN